MFAYGSAAIIAKQVENDLHAYYTCLTMGLLCSLCHWLHLAAAGFMRLLLHRCNELTHCWNQKACVLDMGQALYAQHAANLTFASLWGVADTGEVSVTMQM